MEFLEEVGTQEGYDVGDFGDARLKKTVRFSSKACLSFPTPGAMVITSAPAADRNQKVFVF